jgi:hypothetical protein
MPRLWWALTQDELPRPNGGLSKHIKYYILCLAYARSGGDALRGERQFNDTRVDARVTRAPVPARPVEPVLELGFEVGCEP